MPFKERVPLQHRDFFPPTGEFKGTERDSPNKPRGECDPSMQTFYFVSFLLLAIAFVASFPTSTNYGSTDLDQFAEKLSDISAEPNSDVSTGTDPNLFYEPNPDSSTESERNPFTNTDPIYLAKSNQNPSADPEPRHSAESDQIKSADLDTDYSEEAAKQPECPLGTTEPTIQFQRRDAPTEPACLNLELETEPHSATTRSKKPATDSRTPQQGSQDSTNNPSKRPHNPPANEIRPFEVKSRKDNRDLCPRYQFGDRTHVVCDAGNFNDMIWNDDNRDYELHQVSICMITIHSRHCFSKAKEKYILLFLIVLRVCRFIGNSMSGVYSKGVVVLRALLD